MRGFRFRSSLAEVNEFLKIQVIQDKSKTTRIAMMIWLRVKVERGCVRRSTSQEIK